jgi:very-short-patch-repair endonuclease
MTLHRRLAPLAANQHGLVARWQWCALGITRGVLAAAVARGELRRISSQVVALAGAPDTPDQRILAAVLDNGAGTVATLDTALALWGLPGFRMEPVHLLAPRAARSRAVGLASSVHTSTLLPAHHTTRLRDLPLVTPTRALFELSGRVHPAKLERTLDNCWSRGLTSGPLLHSMLDELQSRGRPRIATMRALLLDRGRDYVPPESGAEARFHQICRENNLPIMRRQVNSGDGHCWLGRMDFRDDELPLVVQVQSELHHAALIDQREDAEQRARLEEAGYVVLAVWQFDLWHDTRQVVRVLHDGRRRARAARARAAQARTWRPIAS